MQGVPRGRRFLLPSLGDGLQLKEGFLTAVLKRKRIDQSVATEYNLIHESISQRRHPKLEHF